MLTVAEPSPKFHIYELANLVVFTNFAVNEGNPTALVAVKLGMLPLPLAPRPMAVLLFDQL